MGTSAWNALCSGKKLWILFHPSTPKHFLTTSSLDTNINIEDNDGISNDDLWEDLYSWIYFELPEIRKRIKLHFDLLLDLKNEKKSEAKTTMNSNFWYREFIQVPGEIVYVPPDWHHAVFNLENSVAITQNYCSRTNLSKCYHQMEDKVLAQKWLESMKIHEPGQVYKMYL